MGVAAGWMASGQVSETNLFSAVNRSIPDGSINGIQETRICASQISQLTTVRVRLKINGNYNGDLYVYLRHLSGQESHLGVLLNRPGRTVVNTHGYSDHGFDATLSDAALHDVHTYAAVSIPPPGAPLAGEWQPDARFIDPDLATTDSPRVAFLSRFNGMPAAGEWVLFLSDVDPGGTNYLESWALELTGRLRPRVSWSPPGPLVYGAVLTTNELNASADAAGSFVYQPPAGTLLNAGAGQSLAATFNPADTNLYTAATTNIIINVAPRPLVITASNLVKAYGQAQAFAGTEFVAVGLVNGETVTNLGLTSTGAPATAAPGVYDIIPSAPRGTLNLSNYQLTLMPGMLSVARATSACSVASSTNPAPPGAPVTFSARLSPQPPSIGTPSGSVQFLINSTNYGAAVFLDGGVATLTTASLARGTHAVAVEYGGDTNFVGITNTLAPSQVIGSSPVAANITVLRPVSGGARISLNYLLANSHDADGLPVAFDSLDPGSAEGGTAQLTNSWTNNWIVYTPPANTKKLTDQGRNIAKDFSGTDVVTYWVRDAFGARAAGRITLNAVPDSVAVPTLRLAGSSNQGWRLQLSGLPWSSYTLLHQSVLGAADWPFLGIATLDQTGAVELQDPHGPSPAMFYRAMLEPEGAPSASFCAAVFASVTTAPQGAPVTFTLRITSPAPVQPQGQAQFRLNGTNYGNPLNVVNGEAQFQTTELPWGRHTVSAHYYGDTNFSAFDVTDDYVLIDSPPITGTLDLQPHSSRGIKLLISDLLNQTSDPDGDPVALDKVNPTSAEGGRVAVSGDWLFYTSPGGPVMSDRFSYTVRDSFGLVSAGVVNLVPTVGSQPTPNLVVFDEAADKFLIQVSAVPWRAYRLEYASDCVSCNWTPLAVCVANAQGLISYEDTLPPGTTARHYQAVSQNDTPAACPFRLACWTNFPALTNNRVMQMWSTRTLPANWPATPPLLAWNTNCLVYGLDGFTAMSQCNSFQGAPGQVPATLITRRHAFVRGHGVGVEGYQTNFFAGQKVWFCTASNTVVEMTLAAVFVRLGSVNGIQYDYGLVVFTEDAPPSLTPISVTSELDLATYYYPTPELPYLWFGTEQDGHVATGGELIQPFVYPLSKGGDSGSPDFIISPDNKLVMFRGRSVTGFSAQLVADLNSLSLQAGLDPAQYQLRWYDLSPWGAP